MNRTVGSSLRQYSLSGGGTRSRKRDRLAQSPQAPAARDLLRGSRDWPAVGWSLLTGEATQCDVRLRLNRVLLCGRGRLVSGEPGFASPKKRGAEGSARGRLR